MGTNAEFIKRLRAGRCRFFLADLHVHSPASLDVRAGDRLNQQPQWIKDALALVPAGLDAAAYDQAILRAVPPPKFLDELGQKRAEVAGDAEPDLGSDWALVAITDHNVCAYACALAAAAYEKRNEHRVIVLPGVELDVLYQIPGTGTSAQIHVLCIFEPLTTDSQIAMAIRDASGKTWVPGAPTDVGSLSDFVHKLRKHPEWPGICIAAHVGSSKGAQRETKNNILSHIEAELSRLAGERESGKEPDLKAIDQRMQQLENLRDPERITGEVLKLIGLCGFDALQVASTSDSVHYRRLHRFRHDHGRSVPIIASDAHSPQAIFRAGKYIPHLKLPALNSGLKSKFIFDQVRQALRYGETRFSSTPQSPAQYWISGIEITRDAADGSQFWPTNAEGDTSGYTLPLPRNLNTLIGGRGSGKSATLEAIAFVAEPDPFSIECKKKPAERQEFYTRAEAILAGCRVKLCWQFSGSEAAKSLPKKALVVERYFDPQHRHAVADLTDANGAQLVPQQIPPHPVQIFRLGEIEKQAGPQRLRNLFDQICGPEILELDAQISERARRLKDERGQMVAIGRKIQDLTREGAPLREYLKRAMMYSTVNTPELSSAYQRIDELEKASAIAETVSAAVTSHLASESVEAMREGMESLCQQVRTLALQSDGAVKPHLELLAETFQLGPNGEKPACQQTFEVLLDGVRSEVAKLEETLTSMVVQVGAELAAAKNALASRCLPSGGKDREAKRTALAESEDALKAYRLSVQEWRNADAARRDRRKELLALTERRSQLRRETGEQITKRLEVDLDATVIKIEADAQTASDKGAFRSWLAANFRGSEFKHQDARCDALLEDGLTPDALRRLLMRESGTSETLLTVVRPSAAAGEVDEENARRLASKCAAVAIFSPELSDSHVEPAVWAAFAVELKEGIWTIAGDQTSALDAVLALDEILFDDVPQIRPNDRPTDPRAKARPVEKLSLGQRCSADLPILLLTGSAPLIIDQPEDNLDNRLIRQVIVNILASIKLHRQVIIATHNPNLPVLGDVEWALVLQGIGDRQCEVVQQGDLDAPALAHHLTEVMEGGREAFQFRHVIYSAHWDGPVQANPVS